MNKEFTRRRNLNRGYMKLEVWQRGMDLFEMGFRLVSRSSDLKLKSQFNDAVRSVSANIAEGYGRRSLPEYIQFLYVSKGSLGEALTRAIGLQRARMISENEFDSFDALHYEVENKLLALIHSLEDKRDAGTWVDALPSLQKMDATAETSTRTQNPHSVTSQVDRNPIHFRSSAPKPHN